MHRAKITGRSVTSAFGVDIYEVAGPASVQEVDGVLLVTTLPTAGRPATEKYAARKATRGSVVCYPRGGWNKVVVTDYIEDGEA